jgi:hypothetical protein
MNIKSSVLVAVVFFFISALASATSVNNIPITGTAWQGFAETYGSFEIQGPGLDLGQGDLDGPSTIGLCTLGTMCNFSFNIGSTDTFCRYCLGLALGTFNGIEAEFLASNITFTGSALYTGQSDVIMPMTFAGIIVGYKLVNCDGTVDCSLGPKVFTFYISGQGTGDLRMEGPGYIEGVSVNFTGTASTVPEPFSILLAGSGLAGIGLARRRSRKMHAARL